MDRILVINAVMGMAAIWAGLYARRLTAALGAGFWLAVVHTVLILLAMGQAGAMSLPAMPLVADELAMIKGALDMGLQMAQLSFGSTALVAYFLATAACLMVLTFACFVIRLVFTGFTALLLPEKVSA